MTHVARLRSRARRRAGHLAGLTAASMLLTLAGPTASAHAAPAAPTAEAADITDGLALWYKLDATSGGTATDASGNGRNGTVSGTADWSASGQGLAFNGSDTYIKVPDDVMKGMNAITVSMDVLIDSAQSTPYFLYGFGNTSAGTGNGYLFTTGNSFRTSVATGNWSTEQTTKPSDSHNLTRGVWKHVTYAQTGSTGVLYEDGVEVGRNTSVTTTPGAIGSGSTKANYIGKSVYDGDKLFKGRIRDFRVYDRALDGSEVEQLSSPSPRRASPTTRTPSASATPAASPRTWTCPRSARPAAPPSAGTATTRPWCPAPARSRVPRPAHPTATPRSRRP